MPQHLQSTSLQSVSTQHSFAQSPHSNTLSVASPAYSTPAMSCQSSPRSEDLPRSTPAMSGVPSATDSGSVSNIDSEYAQYKSSPPHSDIVASTSRSSSNQDSQSFEALAGSFTSLSIHPSQPSPPFLPPSFAVPPPQAQMPPVQLQGPPGAQGYYAQGYHMTPQGFVAVNSSSGGLFHFVPVMDIHGQTHHIPYPVQAVPMPHPPPPSQQQQVPLPSHPAPMPMAQRYPSDSQLSSNSSEGEAKSPHRTDGSGSGRDQKYPASRSIHLGNLAEITTYHDLCQVAVRFGALEFVKIIPQKRCAFVNFVMQEAAESFFRTYSDGPLMIRGNELKIGWAKASPIAPELLDQVKQGVTRCLFVGGLPQDVTEEALYNVFSPYGDFDNIVIMNQKGYAFVNLTSIRSAINARNAVDGRELPGTGKIMKVSFAKENKDARPNGSRQGQVTMTALPPTVTQMPVAPPYTVAYPVDPNMGVQMPGQMQYRPPPYANFTINAARSVYVGNLPSTVSYTDLYKIANQYGPIESGKIVEEKRCCFINFIHEQSAHAFLVTNANQLVLHGHALSVNWAKPSAVSAPVADAIRSGATRSLYLAGISEVFTEEKLRSLFSPFGEIESIVLLRSKPVAFVNMTSVKGAITARNALQNALQDPTDGRPININFANESRPRKHSPAASPTPIVASGHPGMGPAALMGLHPLSSPAPANSTPIHPHQQSMPASHPMHPTPMALPHPAYHPQYAYPVPLQYAVPMGPMAVPPQGIAPQTALQFAEGSIPRN